MPYYNDPVPLLKKHCLDTGREQIDGPTPRPMLYGTRGTTGWTSMTGQQWLNQFAGVTEAQQRERERRRYLHKNFGSMTLFWTNKNCMCEKTIKERELKWSCVSVSMSLPRAYEDPHEPGGLDGVEPFTKAHK